MLSDHVLILLVMMVNDGQGEIKKGNVGNPVCVYRHVKHAEGDLDRIETKRYPGTRASFFSTKIKHCVLNMMTDPVFDEKKKKKKRGGRGGHFT